MGTVTLVSTPTSTATPFVPETGTGVPTGTMTETAPAGSPTAVATGTRLVAQRLAKNNEIRAFAKHAADVAKLHMLLLDDLSYRLAFNITLPEPRFHEEYQSPRRFEPESDDDN
jgi:hypothetical protein